MRFWSFCSSYNFSIPNPMDLLMLHISDLKIITGWNTNILTTTEKKWVRGKRTATYMLHIENIWESWRNIGHIWTHTRHNFPDKHCIRPIPLDKYAWLRNDICKQEALRERKSPPSLVWGAWNSLVRRETVQLIASCVISNISWKFYQYPFTPIMLLTIRTQKYFKITVLRGATSPKCSRLFLVWYLINPVNFKSIHFTWCC